MKDVLKLVNQFRQNDRFSFDLLNLINCYHIHTRIRHKFYDYRRNETSHRIVRFDISSRDYGCS